MIAIYNQFTEREKEINNKLQKLNEYEIDIQKLINQKNELDHVIETKNNEININDYVFVNFDIFHIQLPKSI